MTSYKVNEATDEMIKLIAKAHGLEPADALAKLVKHGFSRTNAVVTYAAKKAAEAAKEAEKNGAKKSAKKSAKKKGSKKGKKGSKKAKKVESTENEVVVVD